MKNELYILSVFAEKKRTYETFQGNLKESLNYMFISEHNLCRNKEYKETLVSLCYCFTVFVKFLYLIKEKISFWKLASRTLH